MKKIRIRFSKHGAVRYIGHLDVMRYFQKTIRRAKINVTYTGGFSPHQVMTFASPLGVGIESDGEYMDIGIEDEVPDTAAIMTSLNEASVPGIRILSVKVLPDDAGNAMSSLFASSYKVTFYEDKAGTFSDRELVMNMINKMNELDRIIYHKETKKTTRDIDLKELIYDLHLDEDSAGNMPVICMTINSSSSDSIKPSFIIEYMCGMYGYSLPENALKILRTDMFSLDDNEKMISMGSIGA